MSVFALLEGKKKKKKQVCRGRESMFDRFSVQTQPKWVRSTRVGCVD